SVEIPESEIVGLVQNLDGLNIIAEFAGEPTRCLRIGGGIVTVGVRRIAIGQDEVYLESRPSCGLNPTLGFCRDLIVSGCPLQIGPIEIIPEPARTGLCNQGHDLLHRPILVEMCAYADTVVSSGALRNCLSSRAGRDNKQRQAGKRGPYETGKPVQPIW